ncbi:hypothetical protein HOY82DRAFT_540150 [Tuber indicum]|nr:hypothetical protein HOY82DRAFT_540150 [Tuber indicum]
MWRSTGYSWFLTFSEQSGPLLPLPCSPSTHLTQLPRVKNRLSETGFQSNYAESEIVGYPDPRPTQKNAPRCQGIHHFKTGSMMDHSVSVTAALRADFGCGSVLYEKRNYRSLADNIGRFGNAVTVPFGNLSPYIIMVISKWKGMEESGFLYGELSWCCLTGPKSSPTITYEDHKFHLTGAPQTAAQKPPIYEVVVNGWVSAVSTSPGCGRGGGGYWLSLAGAEALVLWPSEDPERVDSLWEVVKTKSNVGDKKPVPPNYAAPNISLPTTWRASSVLPTVPAVPGKVAGPDGHPQGPKVVCRLVGPPWSPFGISHTIP